MADETQAKIQQNDVMWGARAIAREIGLDRSAAYHLLAHGHLPAKRIGRRWVSTRTQLWRALTGERQES